MKDLSLARIAMPRTARAAMLRRAMLSRYECIFRFGKEPSVARGNCMLRNASLVPTYSNRTEKFVTVLSACVVPSMRRDTQPRRRAARASRRSHSLRKSAATALDVFIPANCDSCHPKE
jgi:hypothetical protein